MQQKNHDYVDVEDDKYNVDDDGYIFNITEYFFKCKKKKKKIMEMHISALEQWSLPTNEGAFFNLALSIPHCNSKPADLSAHQKSRDLQAWVPESGLFKKAMTAVQCLDLSDNYVVVAQLLDTRSSSQCTKLRDRPFAETFTEVPRSLNKQELP